jgi:hypothetical protein
VVFLGIKKAQAAVEFLAISAVAIAILAISVLLYNDFSGAAARTKSALEAQAICNGAASTFAAFSALGDGASANFSLPAHAPDTDYTVWIAGDRSIVKVDYSINRDRLGVGCHFPQVRVENATGSAQFQLKQDFFLNKTNGVIMVVQ